MRHLDRLPEPAILQRKKAQWLARFLEIARRFAQPDHPFSLMFQVYLGQVVL